MEKNGVNNTRDLSIDILKGIGIIMVLVGHYCHSNKFIFNFCYSFHMPLFFIVAGILFKSRSIIDGLRRDIFRLWIPYCITVILLIAASIIVDWSNILEIKWRIKGAIWCNGLSFDSPYLGHFKRIGAIWFLPALFFCKNGFNALSRIKGLNTKSWKMGVFCFLLSWGAILVFTKVHDLPFGILTGFQALFFLWSGHFLRQYFYLKKEMHSRIITTCFMLTLWGTSIFWASPLLMVKCEYPWLILNIVGGISGTYVLLQASRIILNHFNMCSLFLQWLGRNSLTILCIHLLELELYIFRFDPYIRLVISFVFCLIFLWIINYSLDKYKVFCSKIRTGS